MQIILNSGTFTYHEMVKKNQEPKIVNFLPAKVQPGAAPFPEKARRVT